MHMMINSMKRRNEALQNECDMLAQGFDTISAQLTEAYALLQKYEPEYVDRKLNPNRPEAAVAAEPVVQETAEQTIN
ncbi:hypothetical protein [Rhizobium sp. 9140]|uniref:hypothetical protein n=1 Tax=Rhizobium sp. 9140 TaxID=1761900 RepID=UPI00079B1928|nr:hypothetical protein [Rhizobium sp. 9140]CZT36351.1 hypothetical protein GA0004734_00033500 [Rhizobium sp. 9140]